MNNSIEELGGRGNVVTRERQGHSGEAKPSVAQRGGHGNPTILNLDQAG